MLIQKPQHILAHLYWNPSSDLFVIPFFNHPVKIYGALFALGFLCGYLLIRQSLYRYLLKKETEASLALLISQKLSDRITWMSVIGAVVGARLGHVLFYDLPHILNHPLKLFFTWEGGLASHGGAVGLMITIVLFWLWSKKDLKEISFLKWFDLYVVPVALVAVFIRVGNFFNQEILGITTNVPWAIIFGSPFDGPFNEVNPLPRHPVPLYEACAYLTTFFTLSFYRKTARPGAVTGLFFMLIFGSRFIIEFWKSSQHGIFDALALQTGQLLSIPFIVAGAILFIKSNLKAKSTHRETPQSASDPH